MLICHGANDPMVKLEWAEMSKEYVKKAGVSAEWRLYVTRFFLRSVLLHRIKVTIVRMVSIF